MFKIQFCLGQYALNKHHQIPCSDTMSYSKPAHSYSISKNLYLSSSNLMRSPYQDLNLSLFSLPPPTNLSPPSFKNYSLNFPKASKHFSPDISPSSTECTLSDDSKEEIVTTPKSKFQVMLERRHKDFEIKKKTELCKTFMMGFTCPYGNRCSFAHGTDEIRKRILVSDRYKTVNCHQFYTHSYCNYGPRCQFLHKAANEKAGEKIRIRYAAVERGMELALEYEKMNWGNMNDINEFLAKNVNLAAFNLRRLDVFRLCEDN